MRTYINRIVVLLAIMLAVGSPLWGQWQMAGGAAGPIIPSDNCIGTDDSGNVYVAGSFSSFYLLLQPKTFYNDSFGGTDIFVTKYSAAWYPLWEKQIGGRGIDRLRGMAVDGKGNITLSCDFSGNRCDIDTTRIFGTGCPRYFITRLNRDGDVQWTRTYSYAANWPGCPETYGGRLAAGPNGEVYASMYFVGTMVLGSDTFQTSLYDRYESLVTRYDSMGHILWSKQIHSEPYTFVVVTSIAADRYGNVYGVGFSDGNTQVADPVSASGGGYRWKHFLFKLDSNGFGQHISKLYSNACCNFTLYRVAVDTFNHVYVAGHFGNANTDSLQLGTTALVTTTPATSDVFLARYDADCNLVWARTATGTGNDYLNGLATDYRGRAYIAGSYYSPLLSFGTKTLTREDTFNAFFAAYDSSGTPVYARGMDPNVGENAIADIVCGGEQRLYMAGNFNDSLKTSVYGFYMLPSGGKDALFWAVYHETGLEGVPSPNGHNIALWPNPCASQGILQLSVTVQHAVLTDLAGRVVAQWQQPANKLQMPVLSPGIYILNTTTDDKQWSSAMLRVD